MLDNDKIDLIKQQSILKTAYLLNIDVKNRMAMCFKGHDKNPSLSFKEKEGYFKCFGCNVKGNIINLVMEVKKINFLQACEWIISAFNIDGMPSRALSFNRSTNVTSPSVVNVDEKQYKAPNQEIYEWVLNELGLSSASSKYLQNSRGFSLDSIEKLEIRDLQHPRVFFSRLRARFNIQDLLDCGLLKLDNNQIRNVWWDYVIVFPFRDSQGNIYYMQGRRMNSSINKYINLNGLRPGVYNSKVLDTLKMNDTLYICEGIPDTITAMLLGFNAIGILGATNFSSALAESLIEYRIQVVPDSDRGGETFLKSIRDAFYAKGKSIQKIQIPAPFNDLNEYYISKNCKL